MGRSRIIVVDLNDVPAGAWTPQVTEQLIARLQDAGYTPVFHQLPHASGDHRLLAEVAQAIQPSAVMTILPLDEARRDLLREHGVETFFSGIPSHDVMTEMLAAPVRMQLQHLRERGHTAIAFATLSDPELAPLTRARWDAATASARALGMADPRLLPTGDPGATAAALRDLLAAAPRITAVAGYNDLAALRVLAAADALGLAVPEGLALIGADDLEFAALSHPPLTTVRGDWTVEEWSPAAAAGDQHGDTQPIRFTLVPRSTT
ncbi:substrate-binding domain-containing protein [Dactylosporangium sp. CA-233914]|uniref:substrate-binding domain-containing protein n=1 Tax=Dactylosporangium sp. CA-233914 TaxID=3239934 RepID=UPI003D8CF8B3